MYEGILKIITLSYELNMNEDAIVCFFLYAISTKGKSCNIKSGVLYEDIIMSLVLLSHNYYDEILFVHFYCYILDK